MEPSEGAFAEIVTAVADDPGFAALVTAQGAVLAWDFAADRIVAATPPAAPLARALTLDAQGRLDPRVPAVAHLRRLAAGLAPRAGSRLERLRLSAGGLAPPATFACRLVDLADGRSVLVTAVIGALPRLPRLPPPEEPAAAPPAPPAPPVEPPREPDPGRASVRFVWQADAEGRFTHVSEALARVVGPASAGILGATWASLLGTVVEDPSGAVAAAFARGETWSGRTVLWRTGTAGTRVPVDFAGMPVRDGAQVLRGFRGFGLIRAGASLPAEAEPPSPEPAPSPEPPSPEPPTLEIPSPEIPSPEATSPKPPAEPEVAQPSVAAAWRAPDEAAEADAADEAPAGAGPEPVVEPPVAAGPPDEAAPGPAAPVPPRAREARATTAFYAVAGAVTALLGQPRPAPFRPAPEGEPAPQAADPAGLPDPASPPADPRGTAPPVPPAAPPPAPEAAAAPEARPALRLSVAERSAFREIARALGARFDDEEAPEPEARAPGPDKAPPPPASAVVTPIRPPATGDPVARAFDHLPVGVLVHRGETLLFANRLLLEWLGYETVDALREGGGLTRLFRGRPGALAQVESAAPVALANRGGESLAMEIRPASGEWEGNPAGIMLVRRIPDADPSFRLRGLELDLRARDLRVRELSSILDTATDGVIVLDEIGRILSLNRSAEALFGYDQKEVAGETLTVLLAGESHPTALDYLEGLRRSGVASLLNDGREVLGRVRQGGLIPLFMTMGQVSEGPEPKFCAVLRDITAFKKAEGELIAAKRAAEAASAQKSDFLAKVSHEIRTPLNAIIGFAEVMREERFGPVGNERYGDYLRDIHASGQHVISLVNDLLDLAKIEAGRMELSFTSVNLNELCGACVALMQPQAARERVVVRTSFAARLAPVVADERSVRQIVLNLLSNALRYTDAGGQVIVSTAMTDRGEVALRVRDTGIGMTASEVEAALEPFRQLNTARQGGGTGLGLPLTKALVEANRGALRITSGRDEGTLVEVLFPPTRVLAE